MAPLLMETTAPGEIGLCHWEKDDRVPSDTCVFFGENVAKVYHYSIDGENFTIAESTFCGVVEDAYCFYGKISASDVADWITEKTMF